MIGDLITRLNRRLHAPMLLGGFWSLFWLLNGLDKFFNGAMEPMLDKGLAKGVMLDASGEITSTLYAFEVNGWFGTNRNAKTISFLGRLGVSEDMALGLLYSIGAVEVVLAVLFMLGLGAWMAKRPIHMAYSLLAYKASMVLFMAFCFVDILIGERVELWEHCTFLLVILASYIVFLFRDTLGTRENLGNWETRPAPVTADSEDQSEAASQN